MLETVFVADLDRVAETFGRQQCRLGALALDDGIGRQCRAVNDDGQIGGAERGLAQYRANRLNDGALGRLRRRQDFRTVAPAARLEGNISERAADIDPETRLDPGLRRHVRLSFRSRVGCEPASIRTVP